MCGFLLGFFCSFEGFCLFILGSWGGVGFFVWFILEKRVGEDGDDR